ncbi:MAG: hypothetical protein A2854_01030 [Parcubacteria group bacterium RIFCSPHIGHO2_01_FULL_56_18]|nr:MAG: hypothetical protein A2854_01030 [Parcubacteria group bacterium RIFCSPHIGHO2_01_FULL_56_18]
MPRHHPEFYQQLNYTESFFVRLGDFDSIIYGVVVALGVPVMALSSWTYADRLNIGMFFFAVFPIMFLLCEIGWTVAHIKATNILDPDELSRQRDELWAPVLGTLAALVILGFLWVLPHEIHLGPIKWQYEIRFGPIETLILVHSFVVSTVARMILNRLWSFYEQLSGVRQRFQRDLPTQR